MFGNAPRTKLSIADAVHRSVVTRNRLKNLAAYKLSNQSGAAIHRGCPCVRTSFLVAVAPPGRGYYFSCAKCHTHTRGFFLQRKLGEPCSQWPQRVSFTPRSRRLATTARGLVGANCGLHALQRTDVHLVAVFSFTSLANGAARSR